MGTVSARRPEPVASRAAAANRETKDFRICGILSFLQRVETPERFVKTANGRLCRALHASARYITAASSVRPAEAQPTGSHPNQGPRTESRATPAGGLVWSHRFAHPPVLSDTIVASSPPVRLRSRSVAGKAASLFPF